MVRTKGAKDLKPRKKRTYYAGKPIVGIDPQRFKEWYGKDKKLTNLWRKKQRLIQGAYYKNNRNEVNKRQHDRIMACPEKHLREKIRQSFKYAIRRYILHGKISKPSNKYGINYEATINHLKPFPKDYPNTQVDHIKPLSSFKFLCDDGSINYDEIKVAFAPDNHQWLTAKANQMKNAS